MTSKAEVSLEVELSRDRGGGGAVLLSAGFGVRVEDGCARLVKFGTKRHETGALEAATPWQGHGVTHCEMDTGGFHRYRPGAHPRRLPSPGGRTGGPGQ